MRRTALITGLLGLAAMLTGCGLTQHNEDTVSYDVTEAVAALHVENDSGDVEVVESDRRGIHVSERLSWNKDKPKTSHQVRGDTLELKYTCPTTWGLGAAGVSCRVDYTIEVPKGLRVQASADSGDLTLKGLSGELKATTDSGGIQADDLTGERVVVQTDSGDLTLNGLSGTLDAKSDSGAIEAGGLTGKRVVTQTSSGSVTLTFTAQPDQVTTASDSGSTVVHVPQGPYHIVATTDSGSKEINATADASAPRSIKLSSDSGDIEVVTP
ncbi:DUF4097 domain-containing protein [Nonomuraea sp. MG754425]|uniref:DUF4097 family beta strand repeat-containing protein n=1 Tax=Nonomuraea sp. MG754425 TaxID=2570319 RepID=UPI001F1CA3F8|nr:DUF4097 family beta strand repeat-containing protein [Nonomuraea sp. MG754425]MCF6470323.1 DUF4097 domain-containing protein [Nonomuraea sp. MG754425]